MTTYRLVAYFEAQNADNADEIVKNLEIPYHAAPDPAVLSIQLDEVDHKGDRLRGIGWEKP